MHTADIGRIPNKFSSRLTVLRKVHGLTQQALADKVCLHVNQIKRYEAGKSQPTLDTLVRLAKALYVTLESLVYGGEPCTSDDLKLQLEAIEQFTDEEKRVAKALLNNLILSHTASRLSDLK